MGTQEHGDLLSRNIEERMKLLIIQLALATFAYSQTS
jgi:hypothetical protein